ncbi:MAG: hypothetical protein EBZ58_02395 [Bacteroidetes bacterium]|nr:hypothetical protein [Bacteroidota bacterium]
MLDLPPLKGVRGMLQKTNYIHMLNNHLSYCCLFLFEASKGNKNVLILEEPENADSSLYSGRRPTHYENSSSNRKTFDGVFNINLKLMIEQVNYAA